MLYVLDIGRVNQTLLSKVAFSLGGFLGKDMAMESFFPFETRLSDAPEALGG